MTMTDRRRLMTTIFRSEYNAITRRTEQWDMMRIRRRFWFAVMDAADAIGWERAWFWALQRAADATDWGEGAKCGAEEPF